MEVFPGPFGTAQIKWPLPPRLPLVSVIVPTRDKVKLLRKCVEGVLHGTNYPNLELIIVDNGSAETHTHAYLADICADPRVRVLPYAAPYNYSAINNFAAAQARGEYLCLLNNDTEVLEDSWLREMMRQATRPQVGAVGAKLLYEDRSIQHAGVIIGLGEAAGHAHRFLKEGQPGYFGQAHIPQYVSAVTAACLLVQKSKFEAVGGLDAAELAVAFNDVDFCLKLERAGWRNVYTPQATLIHHESKSRGRDISPQHIDRYLKELKVLQERWSTKTYLDPLHNPNLSKATENFLIGL
jgi:GT2 family glycosyltransferase